MGNKQIAIYGASGFGREVAWLAQTCNSYDIVCFIDDNESKHGCFLNGIPVMSLEQTRGKFPAAKIIGGVGIPKTREKIMEKATLAGFEFETIIHPRVEFSKWIEIGAGSVICAGNILTTNIILGKHVQINLDCTIGHDVIMGDYTTLAPGVHISGWVHCGKRVYVGTGAVIINGTEHSPIDIGDDVIIGAGAVVTKSIPSNVTVVGVPAKVIKEREIPSDKL
ncbi:MAG: acetyltransferase [Thermodesulfobacteriota bacterium]|jgi:sugar O-acyltransferase (sialic acid O-acetyltransferase NeuD family)